MALLHSRRLNTLSNHRIKQNSKKQRRYEEKILNSFDWDNSFSAHTERILFDGDNTGQVRTFYFRYCIQICLLVELRRSFAVLGIKPWSAACSACTFTTVLYLQFHLEHSHSYHLATLHILKLTLIVCLFLGLAPFLESSSCNAAKKDHRKVKYLLVAPIFSCVRINNDSLATSVVFQNVF